MCVAMLMRCNDTTGRSRSKFTGSYAVCSTASASQQETKHQNSHYSDVIMTMVASHITSLTVVYSTIYSGADQSKHQSSASLAFMWGIHRGAVNSPHKWPVTRKMFPFDDVIMNREICVPGIQTALISMWRPLHGTFVINVLYWSDNFCPLL